MLLQSCREREISRSGLFRLSADQGSIQSEADRPLTVKIPCDSTPSCPATAAAGNEKGLAGARADELGGPSARRPRRVKARIGSPMRICDVEWSPSVSTTTRELCRFAELLFLRGTVAVLNTGRMALNGVQTYGRRMPILRDV